jgi:glutaredoxin
MKRYLPLLLIIVALLGYFLFNSQKSISPKFPDSEADLILFWGNGCPHCEKVKTFIKDNNIESKVKIAYKEVYYDKENQKLIEDIVQKCPEIDSSRGVGVPLAFDTKDSKCLYGDTPIIDWLNAK